MRGYQPKFPVTPCQFPVNNVATLTGIVTAGLGPSFLTDFNCHDDICPVAKINILELS